MSDSSASAGQAGNDPLVSPRLELARAALGAALVLPGVISGNAGQRGNYKTQAAETLLTGVLATAEPGGRYSIELFLTAALVPLHPLGEQVQEAVTSAAERAGMTASLGQISVSFLDVDLQDPEGDPGGAVRS